MGGLVHDDGCFWRSGGEGYQPGWCISDDGSPKIQVLFSTCLLLLELVHETGGFEADGSNGIEKCDSLVPILLTKSSQVRNVVGEEAGIRRVTSSAWSPDPLAWQTSSTRIPWMLQKQYFPPTREKARWEPSGTCAREDAVPAVAAAVAVAVAGSGWHAQLLFAKSDCGNAENLHVYLSNDCRLGRMT
ncbi:hypothetical protein S40293_11060 [Stachybotrys chartarum IBT 40293]|nr:hypothetical protein S40293_11060 [Stachybotrys chartarum IBT 40293]